MVSKSDCNDKDKRKELFRSIMEKSLKFTKEDIDYILNNCLSHTDRIPSWAASLLSKKIKANMRGRGNHYYYEDGEHCYFLTKDNSGYLKVCTHDAISGFLDLGRCNKEDCPFYQPSKESIGRLFR